MTAILSFHAYPRSCGSTGEIVLGRIPARVAMTTGSEIKNSNQSWFPGFGYRLNNQLHCSLRVRTGEPDPSNIHGVRGEL